MSENDELLHQAEANVQGLSRFLEQAQQTHGADGKAMRLEAPVGAVTIGNERSPW
jgi:hypothetical protein